ncbi:hypothetical protein Tsubulata_046644 [Turnera subulata]|uniref:Uncharacterized protein n=1 Tax=Turnera subulata TaxID=218843 RepID=A0A9Q0JJD4_9ROSI|nr:hypothetical protein Tsubulata_046644 [Turnera subulata]
MGRTSFPIRTQGQVKGQPSTELAAQIQHDHSDAVSKLSCELKEEVFDELFSLLSITSGYPLF